jgi:hypothetical protein
VMPGWGMAGQRPMKSMDADATPRNDHTQSVAGYGMAAGRPSTVPRCGAKNRRQTSCRGAAMKNGRQVSWRAEHGPDRDRFHVTRARL